MAAKSGLDQRHANPRWMIGGRADTSGRGMHAGAWHGDGYVVLVCWCLGPCVTDRLFLLLRTAASSGVDGEAQEGDGGGGCVAQPRLRG